MIYNESGETVIPIKTAKVTEDVKFQKAQEELKGDIQGYFMERDKTNRGLETKIQDETKISLAEAEVKELLYNDSLIEHPVPTTVKPMFNQIFVSAKRNKLRTESGLWTPTSSFGLSGESDVEVDYQDIQTVMAIGSQVQELLTGMEVKINFENFKRRTEGGNMRALVKKEFEYVVPVVNINGHEYIKISEREVEYISDTKGFSNPIK